MRKGMSYYFAAKYHFLFKWPTITHVMQNQESIYIPARNTAFIWNPVAQNLMISHHLLSILTFASANFLSIPCLYSKWGPLFSF